jgi:Subtilase family
MTGRDYLKIPELEKIFDSAYDAGARVHSNSWGNVGGIYGQLAMDVDKYLHQHEDFFVLFAGGNEGYSGLRSVIAPGNAKNCLTVGATQLRTVAEDERLDDRVSHTTVHSTRSAVQCSAVQCRTMRLLHCLVCTMLHFCLHS